MCVIHVVLSVLLNKDRAKPWLGADTTPTHDTYCTYKPHLRNTHKGQTRFTWQSCYMTPRGSAFYYSV